MKNQSETKIGVFFGSRSPEHDVSIITAELIMKGLRAIGYTVVPIYISHDGQWYIHDLLNDINFFKRKSMKEELSHLPSYSIDLGRSGDGVMVFRENKGWGRKEHEINLAFPAFHGPVGEDGAGPGLFEMFGLPYVGCGVAASAVAMDKVLTKVFYNRYDIPTTRFISFTNSEWTEYGREIQKQFEGLGQTVFIKPARGGSSIGITRADVMDKGAVQDAIEVALHYDDKVIVESAVDDVADLTVAVIGNEEPQLSKIQESRFNRDFFTFDDKYIDEGGAQLGNAEKNIIIPAEIDEKTERKILALAKDIYTVFECSGIARIDFLMNKKTGAIFANEINTLPGTLYHHLWKASGVSLTELLKNLVRFAKERQGVRARLSASYRSDILSHADGEKLGRKLSGDL